MVSRNATVNTTLQELIQEGRVERAPKACYRLTGIAVGKTAAPQAVIDGNGQENAFPKPFPGRTLGSCRERERVTPAARSNSASSRPSPKPTHAVGKLHLQPIMADISFGYPESVPFWKAGLGAEWVGPYFGYNTVDFMIGESLLGTEGGHYAQWLRTHHPDVIALYQPEAALERAPGDLEEAWTSGIPDALHYNTWIADRAVEFLKRAEPPLMLFVSTPDPHHPFSPPRPWADLLDAAAMPAPRVVPEELRLMPEYVRTHLRADWIDNDSPPVEQGGMTVTDGISPASLARAVALTRGMEAQIDHQFGRVQRSSTQWVSSTRRSSSIPPTTASSSETTACCTRDRRRMVICVG